MNTDSRSVYFVGNCAGGLFAWRWGNSFLDCFSSTMKGAKMFVNIGPAKAVCTFFAQRHPTEKVHIIEYELVSGKGKVIDITAHVQASIAKKNSAYHRAEAARLVRQRQQALQQNNTVELLDITGKS